MAEQQTEYEISDPAIENVLDAVDWSTVPTSSTFPEQLYYWEILEVYGSRRPDRQDPTTGEVTDGKAYVGVVCQVIEPTDYAGRQHTENFTIGTDRDPKIERGAETLNDPNNFAAQALTRLIQHIKVASWRNLPGHKFAAFTRNNPSKTEPGRVFTNLLSNRFYELGEGGLLPGTLTITSNRRRPRTFTVGPNGVQPSGTTAATEVPCPVCHEMIEAATAAEHVKAHGSV